MQPGQNGVGFLNQPTTGVVALVDAIVDRVTQLAGEHPVVALAGKQLAHVLFRLAVVVDVGGVNKVDPMLAR